MHYFALYGFMALIFQFAFISNVNAEPVVASVVFEEAKFDGIEWDPGWLHLEERDTRLTEIKAAPKTNKKSERKLSELARTSHQLMRSSPEGLRHKRIKDIVSQDNLVRPVKIKGAQLWTVRRSDAQSKAVFSSINLIETGLDQKLKISRLIAESA